MKEPKTFEELADSLLTRLMLAVENERVELYLKMTPETRKLAVAASVWAMGRGGAQNLMAKIAEAEALLKSKVADGQGDSAREAFGIFCSLLTQVVFRNEGKLPDAWVTGAKEVLGCGI